MIESPEAIKTYLNFMLRDSAKAHGDETWVPLESRLYEIQYHLPILLQARSHYKISNDEFLKFGKPIPRLKEIVEFYSELIELLEKNFTQELAILLECLNVGPVTTLMRMYNSTRVSEILDELENLLFQSLITPVADEEFDELLRSLTAIFEGIPPLHQKTSLFQLSDEIMEKNLEARETAMAAWFDYLDNYWVARSLN